MSILNDRSLDFLTSYLNNPSPTGFEKEGQKKWLNYIQEFVDEWHVDHYGSVYGVINPGSDFRVVIEGHADEISWFVNYITDDGFLHVIRNGGSDHVIAPSKRVLIHGKDGVVHGVFGWPAIHTRTEPNKDVQPSIENIFIDVGAESKQEVLDMGIHVGAVVTYEDQFMQLNQGKYLVGRALDNRIGGFCIAEVARLIKERGVKLPYSLYIVNAVQEEIGLRGAEMVAQSIKPNIAIITDVTHDTATPHMNMKKLGDVRCGKGPSITYAPSVHHILRDLIISTAKEKEIPFQLEAASRSTGTDTDAFAYSNGGVPSALISIPLRYMHTTVEMAHKEDIENVIELIFHTLLNIQDQHPLKYL